MDKDFGKKIEQAKELIKGGLNTKEAAKKVGISWQRLAATNRQTKTKKYTKRKIVTILPELTKEAPSFVFVGSPTQIAEFVRNLQ